MSQTCPGFIRVISWTSLGGGHWAVFLFTRRKLSLGVMKACMQHDTARAGESCPPGWVPPRTLEGVRPLARFLTVTAELAASQGFSPCVIWIPARLRGWAWRGDALTQGLGLHSADRCQCQHADSPARGPLSVLAPRAPAFGLQRRAGLAGESPEP